MSYSELLLVALENIITHPGSSLEIGMTAKDDGKKLREGDKRILDLALQAVYKGTSKGKWSFGKDQSRNERRK